MILGGREIKEELGEENKRYLYEFLKEEMKDLEKLLDLDLSLWRQC